MSQLPGGCTCPKECSNHGNCCACILHHRNLGTSVVHCMREIAQEKYGLEAASSTAS